MERGRGAGLLLALAAVELPVIEVQPLPHRLRDAAVAWWQQAGRTRPWNDPRADLHRALTGSGSTVHAAVDGAR